MRKQNAYYWQDKEERAQKAKEWTACMETEYRDEIDNSIRETKLFDSDVPEAEYKHGAVSFDVQITDSVSGIFQNAQEGKKTAVLNFASYKHPGGGFLEGSRAQEECLCMQSFLYNVLSSFDSYYKSNQKQMNRALYTDRALYSPDVRFFDKENSCLCDVITCASPNFSTAHRFMGISQEENTEVLRSRIRFILKIAKYMHVDTLILGAYGCGVFGQDANIVARLFKEEAENVLSDCSMVLVFAVIRGLPNQKDNAQPFINLFK